MKVVVYLVLAVLSISVLTALVVRSVQLNQNCTGYLKRAADANSVDLALIELRVALNYIENKNLTEGYTSVLWKTPNDDIGFWYRNLKAAENELANVNENTSVLEQTNILMKLRETLLDCGEKCKLTVPSGLSRYPYNLLFGIASWITVVIFLSGFGVLLCYNDMS
jgi:hypothetical protein